MYQIQSVNNGHFFPSPQPRQLFADLRVLALPQVSGEPAHLRTYSPSPKGPPLHPVPNVISKVFSGQRKHEHGFRSPKKRRSLRPTGDDLISVSKDVNPGRKLMRWIKLLLTFVHGFHFSDWVPRTQKGHMPFKNQTLVPRKLVSNNFTMEASQRICFLWFSAIPTGRLIKNKCQVKTNWGFWEPCEGERKIPSKGDTLLELRSACWQLEPLLEWKKNVRYCRDIWQLLIIISLIWNAGNLHSNFKEGDTIEDKKA